jgi:hypothetical protein
MVKSGLTKVRAMDYRNEKSSVLRKSFDRVKRSSLVERLEIVSLKDMPLAARRKEAKKPLFLTRYE